MILPTLVTSQLHFKMCAGLYGHPVCSKHLLKPEQSSHKALLYNI